MEKDNIGPEERLLGLIRGDSKKKPVQKAQVPKKLLRPGPEQKLPKKALLEPFSINLVHRIFLAIISVLAIYLLGDFVISSPKRIEEKTLTLNELSAQALEIPPQTIGARLEPVSYYTEAVKSRNLFTAVGAETLPAQPSVTFMELVAQLRLQGIVSGANPQAIIEDTKAKQVYFLSPGEHIGEIELRQILPGKVILGYYGQEAELGL